MCTPVGHTLAGLSVLNWQTTKGRSQSWMRILWIAIAANLPDIDFLFGWFSGNPNQYHQEMTHSLLFTAGMVGIVWWLARSSFDGFPLHGLLMLAAAAGLHLLLDILGSDTRPPVGIPLFWPFSEIRVSSPWSVFPSVYKSSDSSTFIRSLLSLHNLKVAGVETGVIGGVYWLFRSMRSR